MRSLFLAAALALASAATLLAIVETEEGCGPQTPPVAPIITPAVEKLLACVGPEILAGVTDPVALALDCGVGLVEDVITVIQALLTPVDGGAAPTPAQAAQYHVALAKAQSFVAAHPRTALHR